MDAARRARERAWAASAGDDDEARLLLERVRTGALAPERLELAAWLGQPAARLALGDAAPAGDHVPLGRWARARPRMATWAMPGREAQPPCTMEVP